MIKILIVDDSSTETALLTQIFEEQDDFQVIGHAKNGAEAVELTALLKPDLITMDIQMPVMDGFEATRIIMQQNPTPIVVISANLQNGPTESTFRALDAGALSVIPKPFDITSKKFEYERRHIVDTIRGMAEIKLIKRRNHAPLSSQKTLVSSTIKNLSNGFEIVAIGASIGGTQALNVILSKLPAHFPVPIVIVQHMIPGFIDGFAKWLNDTTKLQVKNITNNEILSKGNVYFAPDNYHLELQRIDHHVRAKLVKTPPVSGFRPSINVLLQSVAKIYGKHALGILLTGMGSDGAEGLLAIKQAKGRTLIQDKKSCIVFGMAAVAESIGAVDEVIQLDQLADYLIKATL